MRTYIVTTAWLLISLAHDVNSRVERRLATARSQGDRGSVTLEQVMVTIGLFMVAGLGLAAIRVAVTGRLNSIAP